MKVFMSFPPRFLEWALAIARNLTERDPNISIMGLVSGSREVFEHVSANDNPSISPLYWLDDLERKWLFTPLDAKRIEWYEEKLGPGVLKRIITADRQLGIGLVSGARIAPTRLMSITKDHEMIRRYVLGLLDFVFDLLERKRPNLVFSRGVAESVSYALTEA